MTTFKQLLIVLCSLGLVSCGGSGGDGSPSTPTPSFPASGTVLSSSCEDYTLTENVADGNGGSTSEVTERSSECGWNPPEAGTESGEWYCEKYDKYQSYHDGEYGTYSELVEENSYDCGYEDPVAVFKTVRPTGDRFNPIVFEVSYEQYGEPYSAEDNPEIDIVDWKWAETDSTIGRIERVGDSLEIYGDGRFGEGIILLNDEEFVYTIEEEPTCKRDGGIDCAGYKQDSRQSYIYYGEDDDQIVEWELGILVYASSAVYGDIPTGIVEEWDETHVEWKVYLDKVTQYNAVYEKSGVHIRYKLTKLYLARWNSIGSLGDIAGGLPVDIVLARGVSYANTCGVARVQTVFKEGDPPFSMSKCTIYTDLHELGHSVGLAHGPENQFNESNGYIFPDFGHGYNDICSEYDDLMSYGYQGVFHSNQNLLCDDIFSGSGDLPAGDRSFSDTAYTLNRVRYNVSLIHQEDKYEGDTVTSARSTIVEPDHKYIDIID